MHATELEMIDYVVGDGEPVVAAHVAACERCRLEVEELQHVVELVNDVPEMPEGLPDVLWERLEPRLTSRSPRWAWSSRSLATAATVAVVVIAGLLAWRVARPPSVAQPAVQPQIARTTPPVGRPFLVVTVQAPAAPPGNTVDDLLNIARKSKSAKERIDAVSALALFGGTEAKLASLYAGEKEPAVREAIAKGLYQQKDAPGLWKLARTEKNPNTKKYIQRLILAVQSQAAQERRASEKLERQP